MKLCDWDRRQLFAQQIKAHIFGKKSMIDPFVFLGYSGDPALQLECARQYVENTIPRRSRWFIPDGVMTDYGSPMSPPISALTQ